MHQAEAVPRQAVVEAGVWIVRLLLGVPPCSDYLCAKWFLAIAFVTSYTTKNTAHACLCACVRVLSGTKHFRSCVETELLREESWRSIDFFFF